MKKIIIFIFLIISFIFISSACKTTTNKEADERMKPITLNYWRVFDGKDDFQEIINNYNRLHPNITINYRRLRYEEFENEILNALAEDRGPDIFSIHNTWLRKYQTKLAPMPASTKMAYLVDVGTIKTEIIPQVRENPSLTPNQLKNVFLDVVYKDVVLDDNKIYGLPLSVDTLAMFYNRDLFNRAGITEAPKYWNRQFQETVRNLTKQDANQNIIQSGVAMGGVYNIERSIDILSVLMMQNGANMMTGDQVTFQKIPALMTDRNYNPGLEALRFYTDFSSINKEVYSWNEDLPDSLEMFTQGNLAIMFGYSYHLPIVKSLSPRLNFAVSSLPQIENSPYNLNFANYWIEVVSHKSEHINEAWDFIKFASSPEQVVSYLNKTNKPTAIRSLINKQSEENEEIRVFINQLLTADSWYRGKNPEAAETAFKLMINNALNSDEELINIMNIAASRINQTIK
jgi:multiple sugar transport system substrate-binding protein